MQDNDETFPPTVTEREAPAGVIAQDTDALQFSIRGRLAPYVPKGSAYSGGVWKCPSAQPWTNINTGAAGDPTTAPAATPIIYWANDYGFNINEAQLIYVLPRPPTPASRRRP